MAKAGTRKRRTSSGAAKKIDQAKLHDFVMRAVGDIGAGFGAVMVLLGDRLGLYGALASGGPATPAQLARRTGLHARYVREWLDNQASGGYVTYDPKSGRYELPPEQAFALADESSPVFLPGAFQVLYASVVAAPRIAECFRTGRGMEWGEHDAELFRGTERFFRPNYAANLVSSWIPALTGVEAKLRAGGKVADVGCGLGASTILMAQAFPKSKFVGFDYHEGSILDARRRAETAGVSDRVQFEVADATRYPGKGYDLVTHFDCLHDMADPVGAARHVKETLAPGGSWMLVEPMAGDRPEDCHNPVGRVFFGASTMLCVPTSLARGGPALGAQAGEARLRKVLREGGFRKVRRAAETPFNIVLEVRA